MDWQAFWHTYPHRGSDGELLNQVGKTVCGTVISQEQFDSLIQDVIRGLDLQASDIVLDLCCGNGLITRELSSRCHEVVGVDFSEPLLEQAKKYNQTENITYVRQDVRQLDTLQGRYPARFTKVLMYEALAYFTPEELSKLFDDLSKMTAAEVRIMLASVLDSGRRWNFFDTWPRKWNYFKNILLLGRDPGIGRWWRRQTLEQIAVNSGLTCSIHAQSEILHTAHYRMDTVFSRADPHVSLGERNHPN